MYILDTLNINAFLELQDQFKTERTHQIVISQSHNLKVLR